MSSPIETTRGPATAPVWEFTLQGTAVKVTRVAIAHAVVVAPDDVGSQRGWRSTRQRVGQRNRTHRRIRRGTRSREHALRRGLHGRSRGVRSRGRGHRHAASPRDGRRPAGRRGTTYGDRHVGRPAGRPGRARPAAGNPGHGRASPSAAAGRPSTRVSPPGGWETSTPRRAGAPRTTSQIRRQCSTTFDRSFDCAIQSASSLSLGIRRTMPGRAATTSWTVVARLAAFRWASSAGESTPAASSRSRVLGSDALDAHQVDVVDPLEDELAADPGRRGDPLAVVRLRAGREQVVGRRDARARELLAIRGTDPLDVHDLMARWRDSGPPGPPLQRPRRPARRPAPERPARPRPRLRQPRVPRRRPARRPAAGTATGSDAAFEGSRLRRRPP